MGSRQNVKSFERFLNLASKGWEWMTGVSLEDVWAAVEESVGPSGGEKCVLEFKAAARRNVVSG